MEIVKRLMLKQMFSSRIMAAIIVNENLVPSLNYNRPLHTHTHTRTRTHTPTQFFVAKCSLCYSYYQQPFRYCLPKGRYRSHIETTFGERRNCDLNVSKK